MSNKVEKYLKLAHNLALKSDHHQFRMSCILFKKNRIISVGINKIKTHPKSPHPWRMMHCEFDAIVGIPANELKGSEIFVYRENLGGKIGMARPCLSCQGMLTNLGIYQVYYTTSEGIIEENLTG